MYASARIEQPFFSEIRLTCPSVARCPTCSPWAQSRTCARTALDALGLCSCGRALIAIAARGVASDERRRARPLRPDGVASDAVAGASARLTARASASVLVRPRQRKANRGLARPRAVGTESLTSCFTRAAARRSALSDFY
eukprot:6201834-Pleurochrysis_carterae.AAC.1